MVTEITIVTTPPVEASQVITDIEGQPITVAELIAGLPDGTYEVTITPK